MEKVDDERGIGAVMLDRLGIGAAHIATGPLDPLPLGIAEVLVKEQVDSGAAFALTNPDDLRPVQIIDDGGELAALQVGNLIDAQRDQPPDLVTEPGPGDDAMKNVGHSRRRHLQDRGRSLLGHDLAQRAEPVLQPVSHSGLNRRPGDIFLDVAVSEADNFLGRVEENDASAKDGDIGPYALIGHSAGDASTSSAFWTPATVLERLDSQVKLLAVVGELEPRDFHLFQV